MGKMKVLFSKIFLCHTHKRFKVLFDKIEAEGYRLYVRGDTDNPEYKDRVRRYFKNLGRAIELHNKFTR